MQSVHITVARFINLHKNAFSVVNFYNTSICPLVASTFPEGGGGGVKPSLLFRSWILYSLLYLICLN